MPHEYPIHFNVCSSMFHTAVSSILVLVNSSNIPYVYEIYTNITKRFLHGISPFPFTTEMGELCYHDCAAVCAQTLLDVSAVSLLKSLGHVCLFLTSAPAQLLQLSDTQATFQIHTFSLVPN